jgi:surface antigen
MDWKPILDKSEANKGMTINISIVPEPKSNWFLVLCDPSGKKILRTYYPPSEDNPDPTDNWPKSTGIRIAFDGNYSLYITGPDAFSHSYTVDINTSNSIPSSTTSAVTDDQLIAQAQQAAQSKVQPANYTSCLVYAQARGLGVTAKGNTGAFNILYQGDDAKLVNNSPTSQLKTGIISLNNAIDLTTILHPGDFIVWQRGVAQADSTYGHIAVVELVEANRLVISQSDWSPAWKVLHTSDFVSGMYGYPLGLQ